MLKRKIIQWSLIPFVFLVIGLGWKYPLLGFIVPVVMFIGIIGAIFNGRYVCGNLCPRGAFYDRLIYKISPQKKIPAFFKKAVFRWLMFILLMSFMVLKVFTDPTSWQHWGLVFWQMCFITTLLGLILAVFIHQRTWCAFCPIGTLAAFIGGHKKPLHIHLEKCIRCKKCERVCPMQINILASIEKERLNDPDCLKCGECILACPKKIIR